MVLLWQTWSIGSWAHGGGTSQLANAVAGPYRVFAWTTPEPWRAGEVHVTIAVTLPPPQDVVVDDNQLSNMLEEPVTDATVLVRFDPGDGSQPIELAATQTDLLGGTYYEADTDLPHDGPWQVLIDVDGPLGAGRANFIVTVLPAQQIDWLWLGIGAAVGVGGLALVGLSRRASASNQSRRVSEIKKT
jgi:hypothetical protein